MFYTHFSLKDVAVVLFIGLLSCQRTTQLEKAEQLGDRAVVETNQIFRDAQDQICKMNNGVLTCLPKVIQNKVKTSVEEVEMKAQEAKDSID